MKVKEGRHLVLSRREFSSKRLERRVGVVNLSNGGGGRTLVFILVRTGQTWTASKFIPLLMQTHTHKCVLA